jgi:hypothetical protein
MYSTMRVLHQISYIFLNIHRMNSTNRVAFVMDAQCVFFYVRHDFYVHQFLALRPSYVPQKVGVNQGAVNQI